MRRTPGRYFFAVSLSLIPFASCGGTTVSVGDGGGGGDGGPDDACACVDVQPSCVNGQTKKIDCNTCTCSQGTWACTAIACVDAAPPLPTSDPGSVSCNGMTCAAINHFCCDQMGVESCMSKPKPGTCAGSQRECDEKADCIGANVCCIPPNQNILLAYNTMCAANCGMNDPFSFQVCKTSAECQNGMACIGQPCLGKIIYTCGGAIPPNRCQ
jgi:hypothetical protein